MPRIRNKTLAFRVSEEEYTLIKNKVAESGKRQSDFILDCCLNKKIVSASGIPQLTLQMGKIGNTLNQLAKKASQGVDVPRDELESMKRELDNALRFLKGLYW